MEGFEALKYVTGGVTLLGLIVLAGLAIARSLISRDLDVLRNVKGDAASVAARERVAVNVLERFNVDTTGMSSADKKELALAQLIERRKRATPILILCFGLAVVGLVGTIVVARGTSTVQVTGEGGQNIDGDHNVTVSGGNK